LRIFRDVALDWHRKNLLVLGVSLIISVIDWRVDDGSIDRFIGIQMCPATMRSYIRLSDGRSWRDRLAVTIEAGLERIRVCGGHQWCGPFVYTTGHYPSADEVVEFMFNHSVIHRNRVALVQDIKNFADLV
jgi:hypothetical protein